ncbi:MAG: 50S ribosomal protein L11 methyltransferase [Deltaproteobacteria bacterium]|jgi:ribosomal protein L11 methyltransferase|nr:50S ribosomal protein L11 methyltransferase [Deltaproteobacteria bacterium]
MEDWLGLTLAAPPLAGEAVSDILFEAGADGIWEDTPDIEGRLVFRAGFPLGHESRLMAEIPAGLVRVAESLDFPLTSVTLSLEIKPAEDFSQTWKKDLKPFGVGSKLWIAPSWWTEPLPCGSGTKILRIDPGLAFGSGRHASTFLCLTLIHDLATPPARLLDIGAGSGILGLAAATLYPEAQVVGLDTDADTIKVAEDNGKNNKLDARANFSNAPLAEQGPGYDLIVANLTLNVLIELAPEIKRLLAPQGQVIVSGLLADQTAALEEVFQALGLGCLRHLGQGEWSALLLGSAGTGASRQVIEEPPI